METHISLVVFWIIEGLTGVILNILGLYLLLTDKRVKVHHLILIHLSGFDFLYLTLEVAYHSSVLILYGDVSTRHMLKKIATTFLLVGQYQIITLLTIDRVLAVALTVQYKALVTRRRAAYIFTVVWMVCWAHIPYSYFTGKTMLTTVWTLSVLAFIVVSYVYIALKMRIYHRSFQRELSNSSVTKAMTLKHRIPLLIVISFIVFICVPNLLWSFVGVSPWYYGVRFLNYTLDPLVYILGCPRHRNRVMKYFRRLGKLSRDEEVIGFEMTDITVAELVENSITLFVQK